MFRYRHDTTTTDLAAHDRFHGRGTLRLAISGSSGLLESYLTPFLTTGGHTVLRLVRDGSAGPNIPWSLLDSPQKLADALDGVDAVVHLAGENIAARRWTRAAEASLMGQSSASNGAPGQGARPHAPPAADSHFRLGGRRLW